MKQIAVASTEAFKCEPVTIYGYFLTFDIGLWFTHKTNPLLIEWEHFQAKCRSKSLDWVGVIQQGSSDQIWKTTHLNSSVFQGHELMKHITSYCMTLGLQWTG